MAQRNRITLGVTPPISTNFPVDSEIIKTDELQATLRQFGQYETDQEQALRRQVLSKLNEIFKVFVRTISIKNGLPESLAREVGGMIFTFGSYRLGVHEKASDIDTLCVAPKHVKREDFLEHMYDALKKREEVTEITSVPDAYVPVIKMQFSGISIDLLFARLGLASVPDDLDLADDSLLKNLDERCIRSLNGSRVTDAILNLVPNVTNFRIALRCIKLWAKKKAIYSNVSGFFGGVAWAIVTARVCQLYPNATASAIVVKFFKIMLSWEWPQPVLLKQIEEGALNVRVWNPKVYPQDKAHRMPVITPSYPSMCSTHNICSSTQQVTTKAFEDASIITEKVLLGEATWLQIFKKHDFFHRYKYYLQIIATSDNDEQHLKWGGMVESRLRQLVLKLEFVEMIELAHPFIRGIERTAVCRNDTERRVIAAGGVLGSGCHADAAAEAQPSSEDQSPVKIYSTCFYIGLMLKPRDKENPIKQLDISWPTNEFMKLVKGWDKFDEEHMAISVRCLMRC